MVRKHRKRSLSSYGQKLFDNLLFSEPNASTQNGIHDCKIVKVSVGFGNHWFRGGATVLKVGGQNVIRSLRSRKKFFCTSHIWKSGGYNFLHITISIEYTEICCLVVALLHISYAYTIVSLLWTGSDPVFCRGGHTLEHIHSISGGHTLE